MNFAFAENVTDAFYHDVITGLSSTPKKIPCKYLYDAAGSKIFEQITQLPEYYPTRTEVKILEDNIDEISAYIGSKASLIEFGSGAGHKTRLLLNALNKPASYIPVEISKYALTESVKKLQAGFPTLNISPLCADYTDPGLYEVLKDFADFTIFFPGSTIGNFEQEEAIKFLSRLRELVGRAGGILIGVDLMKPPVEIVKAYDDGSGITAEFNKNILARANRELGANFEINNFAHEARFNWQKRCVEMHLVSLWDQTIHIRGIPFYFAGGETIHTESSHKYTVEDFADLANNAGLHIAKTWTDERDLFSVHYLKATT